MVIEILDRRLQHLLELLEVEEATSLIQYFTYERDVDDVVVPADSHNGLDRCADGRLTRSRLRL